MLKTASCMSFVADLRDAINGFNFANRTLCKLPSLQTASSSSYTHRVGLRCFCLRTNIKLTLTQDNYLNTSIYMPLAELRQKRESNYEAYASKSDALL